MTKILDRDIRKSEWYQYLKKYKKTYRLFLDEIGIWSIKCKYGFVQPYSIVNKKLVAVLTYKTQRGMNILLKNLQSETAPAFEITQHGDFELSVCFDEKDIKYFAKLLSFGYVRQISEKQRIILAERLKKARLVKNGGA